MLKCYAWRCQSCGYYVEDYVEYDLRDEPRTCPDCESDDYPRVPVAPAVLRASYLDGQRRSNDSWKKLREAQDLKLASTKTTNKSTKSELLKEAKKLTKL